MGLTCNAMAKNIALRRRPYFDHENIKILRVVDHGFPQIEHFYSDSLADTPLALCAEKAHLVTNKAGTVVDWPDLDAETAKKVKKKINTGWNTPLKE